MSLEAILVDLQSSNFRLPSRSCNSQPGSCAVSRTTDATNLSIRTHNAFREVESAMFCKHLLNSFRDELAIVGVDELDILFHRRGLASRIKAINPEQLWRPVVESSSVEGPATGTRKA